MAFQRKGGIERNKSENLCIGHCNCCKHIRPFLKIYETISSHSNPALARNITIDFSTEHAQVIERKIIRTASSPLFQYIS